MKTLRNSFILIVISAFVLACATNNGTIFTVAVPEFLSEVYGLTRTAALVNSQNFYGERYPYGVLAPAVASARFTISGVGSKPGI